MEAERHTRTKRLDPARGGRARKNRVGRHMSVESTLAGWTGPSSETEQDRQERTERMVKEAITTHDFGDCRLSVYAKGSYANNTNVRTDSDVDIAVQCHNVEYWKEATPGVHPPGTPYAGIWTPSKLRAEVTAALRTKFPGDIDESGSTAIRVRSSTARVDADVVPCFDYRHYFSSGGSRTGTKVFRKNGDGFVNYPIQQLANGRKKNDQTNTYFKQAVRVLKRVENVMLEKHVHREVESFFIECLTYNCPKEIFLRSTWTDTIRGLLGHIWDGLQGDPEPSNDDERWLEVSECKYLFHAGQPWTRADGRDFAYAVWNYLGFK
jgi:hypothetical protein